MTPTLFESARMTMDEAQELTRETMAVHLEQYDHLAFAFSGGKDSSATLSLIVSMMERGMIRRPRSIIAFYADTRLELTPLEHSARRILYALENKGIETKIVMPELDDRFFVYILGRGVPPPSNTFRWCTSQLKIEPMQKALEQHAVDLGLGEMVQGKTKPVYRGFGKEKILMITGVRLGESAARDERIVLSCSKDGAECGQGWLQQSARDGLNDTLAPLLHWRVCHVWDWLNFFAPDHGFPTRMIAECYGGDEAQEINARTGCVGCNLASRDVALETLIQKYPETWGHLAPLMRLRGIYAEMKKPENRLRKWGELLKDGSLAANQGRLGPLTLEARERFLVAIEDIQNCVNFDPRRRLDRRTGTFDLSPPLPGIDLINIEEKARIIELIRARTWPQGWTGDEMIGDEMTDRIHRDGTIQPWMFGESKETTI